MQGKAGEGRQPEPDGLVTRTSYPQIPPRVEYEITESGRSLTPVFASLVNCSEEHLSQVVGARR